MRQRERCVGCEVPHMMDDLGVVKPEDTVIEALCEKAIMAAAHTLKMLGDQERTAIDEAGDLPPGVGIELGKRSELVLETDETGTETSAVFPAKVFALSLAAAILLLITGILIGRFLP